MSFELSRFLHAHERPVASNDQAHHPTAKPVTSSTAGGSSDHAAGDGPEKSNLPTNGETTRSTILRKLWMLALATACVIGMTVAAASPAPAQPPNTNPVDWTIIGQYTLEPAGATGRSVPLRGQDRVTLLAEHRDSANVTLSMLMAWRHPET